MSGKAIRETLGFVAVVASMVFIGLEIRQNTTATKGAAIQDEVTPEVDPGITGLSTSFWFWRDVPRSVNIVPRTPLESAVPASYVV